MGGSFNVEVQGYHFLQFGEILVAPGHLISRPGGIPFSCCSGDRYDVQSVCTRYIQ